MSDTTSLGALVELVRGKTYKGNLVGAPGPALLGLGSIVPGGGFRDDYRTYGGDCPPDLMLEPGDLYVSLKGATKDGEMIGSVARLPDSVPSGRLTQDTVRLAFRTRNLALERYIYWLLRTPHYRAYCAARATGSAVVGLSRADFLAYPVPPLNHLRSTIVSLLEDLESMVESNRRAVSVASSLLDAMAEQVAIGLPVVPLGDVALLNRSTTDPAQLGDVTVNHYSLPAFDDGALPERVLATSIKSNKTRVDSAAILVSRLNPRINRTWWVKPDSDFPSLASTEFGCLVAPLHSSLAGVWLAVREPEFRRELTRRVTGTSGSHQRVRPDDLLAIDVMDIRELDQSVTSNAAALLSYIDHTRSEDRRLAALRNALLPLLHEGLAPGFAKDLQLKQDSLKGSADGEG